MSHDVRRYAATLLCALAVGAASARPARAQATDRMSDSPKPIRLDVTPFVAMGDDFAPGLGGAFTFGWTRTLSVEAEAGIGTDAARTSLSLLYGLPALGRFAVYVAGGAGVQRDEFETIVLPVGRVINKKTEFAVNVGAGVTIPINDRFSYRADFRWYNPKREWPESWRVYSGVTVGLRQ